MLHDMRADEGFVHAWTVPVVIDDGDWRPLHEDLVRVLRAASVVLERGRSREELAMLRGPSGLGRLIIDPDRISFNGNAFLGQSGDAFVLEQRATAGVIA